MGMSSLAWIGSATWSITNGPMHYDLTPLVTASIPVKTYFLAMIFFRRTITRGSGDQSTSYPTAGHEDDERNPIRPTIQTLAGPRIARASLGGQRQTPCATVSNRASGSPGYLSLSDYADCARRWQGGGKETPGKGRK